jgi:hypothetical protein
MKISLAIALFISFAAVEALGQASNGLVEKLSGTVFLRHDANAKEARLDSRWDTARRLYAGEQVRCEPGGFLRLRVGGRLKEIYGPSGWFTIPRPTSGQADPLQRALDEYGRRGGRDRGGEAPAIVVFSPSKGSAVSPGKFVISWKSLKAQCHASFTISDEAGDLVWKQDDVPGKAGVLNSAAVRRALRNYRSKLGEGPLNLTVNSSCGDETQSRFTLLKVADEQSLARELAHWNKDPGNLTRHVGRAAVFTQYKMFSQAAAEYEAALARAPQSSELLMRTIVAQRKVGNSARELALTKRLPVGIEVP